MYAPTPTVTPGWPRSSLVHVTRDQAHDTPPDWPITVSASEPGEIIPPPTALRCPITLKAPQPLPHKHYKQNTDETKPPQKASYNGFPRRRPPILLNHHAPHERA